MRVDVEPDQTCTGETQMWWFNVPPLRNLEASTLTKDEVACRHADIVEDNLRVVVFMTENRERPQNCDSRSVTGYNHHGLLRVDGTVESRLPKRDEDLAFRANSSRDVPFVPVDHVFIRRCVVVEPCRDVCCVR